MSAVLKTSPKGRHLEGFRENPVSAAVAIKLVEDQRHVKPVRDGIIAPETSTLAKVSQMTAGSIQDAKNIFEVLPETELVMQILVSGILSPNDFRTPELSWSAENSVLSPGLIKDLIEIVRTHFEKTYRIKDVLPKLLQDTLFHTGSYPLIIIPESSMDDIINPKSRLKNKIALESLKSHFVTGTNTLRPSGWLGNPTSTVTLGIEDILAGRTSGDISEYNPVMPMTDNMVTVTDNVDALKLPLVVDATRREKAAGILGRRSGLSNEALKIRIHATDTTDTKKGDVNQLYQRRNPTQRTVQAIGTSAQSSRAPVGHPLVIKAPSESVIPVTLPGSPDSSVGAFVLIDDFGNPVTYTRNNTYFSQLNSKLSRVQSGGGQAGASDLLQRLNQYTNGTSTNSMQMDLDKMYQAYGMVVENDLKARIRNGLYGGDVDIACPEEAYRIMFARQMANQRTQLLWVPGELLTYVAFDYNDMGIGISLIEKSKLLSSVRAVLTVVNTLGAIKNSTARRRIDIQLDPAEEDPAHAVELLTTEIAKVQGGAYPLGSTSPVQITDLVRMAGIEINVSGHPAYPETKVITDDIQSARVLVDTEFEDIMRKRWLMSFGLTPETVDAASGTDFAANVIQSNLLLNKRIAVYQEATSAFVTDHIVKYTRESGALMRELTDVVNKHVSDTTVPYLKDTENGEELKDITAFDIIAEFLETVDIQLPPPDTTKIAADTEQFTAYRTALEEMLPAYIPEEVFTMMGGGEGSERYKAFMETAKSYFLRKYMADNNILPELQVLLSAEDLTDNEFNLKTEHVALMEALGRSIGDFVKGMGLYNDQRNEALTGDPVDSTTSVEPADDTATGSDDLFGGDDDDFKFDDEPITEENPEPVEGTDDEPKESEEEPAPEEKKDDDVTPPVEEPGLDEEPT